jgi:hypothetical protein
MFHMCGEFSIDAHYKQSVCNAMHRRSWKNQQLHERLKVILAEITDGAEVWTLVTHMAINAKSIVNLQRIVNPSHSLEAICEGLRL